MSGKDQTFIASDGVRIVYDDVGGGPVVMLVHGYSGDKSYWHFQKGFLVRWGYRVIAIDLRNHGRSDRPTFGHRMSRHGLDIKELIVGLKLVDVTLVGHSFGVNAILAMFSLSGFDGVSRFVAVDQSPKIMNDETWQWGIKGVSWATFWDQVTFRTSFGEGLEPPRLPHVREVFGVETDDPFDGYDHPHVTQLLVDHFVTDWRDVLPQIKVPSWVVTGRHTPYYHLEGMQWYAQQLPNAYLTCFENSGHDPAWNDAEGFNAELLAFLKR